MRHRVYLSVLIGCVLGLSGCIYLDTETPGAVQGMTEYQLTSEDFKVIERVSVTGETSLWLFGTIAIGGKGYQALLEKAQSVGGDTLMDYSFDIEQKGFLFCIYCNFKWKATGLAIQFTERVKR